MLGMPKGEILIVPWSKEWEREFLQEKEKIEKQLGGRITAVHHIGSTAVEKLNAKPIIDIAVEVEEFKDGEKCIRPLEELGYTYKGTDIVPDRYYFSKGEPRTHQIHLHESGNPYLQEQLQFRDHLRTNEQARIDYEELKKHLASEAGGDKYHYNEGKTGFIQEVLKQKYF
jgi:GrpB-like predicted nucleotidyltransferase (UPF0157 family)